MKTIIADKPPQDCRDWHCQCARCGSSVHFETCENCGGDGVNGHDCFEDCCCCLHPEDNVRCDMCAGEGSFGICLSSPEWCEAHPMRGREDVERGKVEWFCVGDHKEETTQQ